MKVSHQPTESRCPFVPVVRPSGKVPVVGQIVTDQLPVFSIHRFQGRTVPCQGTKCPCTTQMWTTEERIYLPLYLRQSRSTALLDLPASHWSTFKHWQDRGFTLSSLVIRASRIRPQDNAPIAIECRPLREEEYKYSGALDAVELLAAITARNVEFALWSANTAKTASTRSPQLNDRTLTRPITP